MNQWLAWQNHPQQNPEKTLLKIEVVKKLLEE